MVINPKTKKKSIFKTQEDFDANERAKAQFQATVTQTEEQKKASERGVSVEAFRDPQQESRRQFQERQQTTGIIRPQAVTVEQIKQEQFTRENVAQDIARTREAAERLESGEDIEQVFPEAILEAQQTKGIGSIRSPQEVLNPDNTTKGAIKAGLLTAIPVLTLGMSSLKGTLGFAGGLLGAGSVGGFASAFTRGKQTTVKGDIANILQGAKFVVKTAQEDPEAASRAMAQAESNMINEYGKLHVLYTQDPTRNIAGEDVEEDLAAGLRAIQSYKEKIERYRLTGNPAELAVEQGVVMA